MNVDVKHLEYGAVCALMIVLMFIFRDKTPEVHKIKPPEISEEEFDSHPLLAWPDVNKKGNVCKIKYRVTNSNTRLWVYDVETGNLVHKQPYSRDPKQDGSYRDFVYTWKLYKTEWTTQIDSGTYEIVLAGDIEPHSTLGKLTTFIDIF